MVTIITAIWMWRTTVIIMKAMICWPKWWWDGNPHTYKNIDLIMINSWPLIRADLKAAGTRTAAQGHAGGRRQLAWGRGGGRGEGPPPVSECQWVPEHGPVREALRVPNAEANCVVILNLWTGFSLWIYGCAPGRARVVSGLGRVCCLLEPPLLPGWGCQRRGWLRGNKEGKRITMMALRIATVEMIMIVSLRIMMMEMLTLIVMPGIILWASLFYNPTITLASVYSLV